MAERRENSVLFSLRELRQIEDDRVKTEEDEVKRQQEEQRQAALAAERAKQEAAERARQEAIEAEQRRIQMEEQRLRDEQLRLQEVERTKRVEAEAALEQERVRLEIEARTQLAARRKPWGLIISASVLFVLVAGLGIFLYVQDQKAKVAERNAAAEKKRLEDEKAELQKKTDEQLKKMAAIDAETEKLVSQLRATQNADEQKRIQGEIDANRARRKAEAEQLERIKQADITKRKSAVNVKCKDPSDPLCGI